MEKKWDKQNIEYWTSAEVVFFFSVNFSNNKFTTAFRIIVRYRLNIKQFWVCLSPWISSNWTVPFNTLFRNMYIFSIYISIMSIDVAHTHTHDNSTAIRSFARVGMLTGNDICVYVVRPNEKIELPTKMYQ